MKKAWSLLLLGSIALAAIGCNQGEEQVGGAPRPVAIHSVVSLSPSTTELSAPVGFSGMLKGVTSSCNYPNGVQGMEIVADVKPNYEKITKIAPELILVDKSLYPATDLEKIKGIGGKVFVWDPKDLDTYEKELKELSSIVGQETAGSRYLDLVHEEIINAKGRANGQSLRTALIIPDAGGKHLWAGTDSFYAAELKGASLTPVGPKSDKYEPVDAEQILKEDPDFILLAGNVSNTDKANAAYTAFTKDPRMATLKAVKDGKVAVVNQDMALRAGGRVDIFIKRTSQAVYGVGK